MSLVGPRPHALAHDDKYRVHITGYADRYHVIPGLTGWAQVNGLRNIQTGSLNMVGASDRPPLTGPLWFSVGCSVSDGAPGIAIKKALIKTVSKRKFRRF
jgi:hypothetical protein